MIPQPVTDEMVNSFTQPSERGPGNPEAKRHTFAPPPDMVDCNPCEAVIHRDPLDGSTLVVRVPLKLEGDEFLRLMRGGTVWLTTYGSLVPFSLEVQ